MTLRNMRIFLAVADCGSMSEAAKSLSIAQPSVSGTIAEIEEQYGVRLFERLGRRLYITQTGRQLEEYARQITSMFDSMEQELRNSDEGISLLVGATITVGTCIMCDVLDRYRGRCPSVVAKVHVDNTEKIEQMLLHSQLDVAIVEGKIKSKDLLTEFVMQDPLILVASAQNNPFVGRSSVTKDDLIGIPFIMRESGSGTRELFEQAMGPRPITEQWICNNSEAILNAVERGFGCTVISRRLAQCRLDSGALVEIPVEDAKFERIFTVVWHKKKYIGEHLKQFLQMCKELE